MDAHRDQGAVVVGVDGSGTSLNAVRWAAYAAERLHTPLVIACAPPFFTHRTMDARTPESNPPSRWHRIAESTADHAAALVRTYAPELPVATETTPEAPDLALISRSAQARLLVVGAQTAWDNRVVGPTTMAVARHAHCPVVVWRGVAGRPIPRRSPVAVGVDGTPLSTGALELGFELADAFGVSLLAVHARPHRIAPVGRQYDHAETEQNVPTDALAPYRTKYPHVEATEVTVTGVPATMLAAMGRDAQLLVVGTRARNAATAALFGSTSRDLLHHAPCPVLLYR
ncbi:universal stress protein [Nocardia huaxiensis]|uniref:Universal stress protein n=1 Tax=Nocardia huaxiensis TaxID=2755382 RepID=A0A7D6Z798_9NOCA|nr:universal stress protein [Nocardia huaxiensis]QLY28588.1 universal stress protein [Nocardia huaxiensis]